MVSNSSKELNKFSLHLAGASAVFAVGGLSDRQRS